MLELSYNVFTTPGVRITDFPWVLQKESLQKDFFCFSIKVWARACGVWSNILALAPRETSANLVGSTPESLVKTGLFGYNALQ